MTIINNSFYRVIYLFIAVILLSFFLFYSKDFRTFSANIYFVKYINEISTKTMSTLTKKTQLKKNLNYAKI